MEEARIKVGLIVPSSNTTVEWDFQRLMPRHVSLHSARMWLTGSGAEGLPRMNEDMEVAATHLGSAAVDLIVYACTGGSLIEGPGHDVATGSGAEGLPRMNEDMEVAATHLGSAAVDLIVYACTGGSLIEGPGHDTKISQRITELTGIAATTISTASRQAMTTLDMNKLVVCCPYQDSMTEKVGEYLNASGYDVVSLAGRRKEDNLAIGNDPLDEIVDFVADNTVAEADGIFLSCTNWRTTDVCQRIEDRTGKPVVTANQATVWATRHLLGFTDPVDGFGRLMQQPPAAAALAAE